MNSSESFGQGKYALLQQYHNIMLLYTYPYSVLVQFSIVGVYIVYCCPLIITEED